MKKALLVLTALALMLALAACAGANTKPDESVPQTGTSENGEPSGSDDGTVKCEVAGHEIRLNRPSTHRNMHFLESIFFEKAGYDQVVHLNYAPEGEDRLFVIHIIYFVGTPIEDAMGDNNYVYSDKTFGDVAYKYFEDTVEGVPSHNYVCNYLGDTYVISFESTNDIKNLETAFMNNVSFSKTEE